MELTPEDDREEITHELSNSLHCYLLHVSAW